MHLCDILTCWDADCAGLAVSDTVIRFVLDRGDSTTGEVSIVGEEDEGDMGLVG